MLCLIGVYREKDLYTQLTYTLDDVQDSNKSFKEGKETYWSDCFFDSGSGGLGRLGGAGLKTSCVDGMNFFSPDVCKLTLSSLFKNIFFSRSWQIGRVAWLLTIRGNGGFLSYIGRVVLLMGSFFWHPSAGFFEREGSCGGGPFFKLSTGLLRPGRGMWFCLWFGIGGVLLGGGGGGPLTLPGTGGGG